MFVHFSLNKNACINSALRQSTVQNNPNNQHWVFRDDYF